ncbi:hypothetical protein J2S43_007876 [Catenuloplanes nepalensis]|uniref:Transcriptional regulator WhiB n=1 Tax=Catenuloplanes nepalensis TaxID=587533 RepID=A0ABT9N6P4_9ACTN|nr:WhiB family transcriptional regulator [Catenuloplanes nepalensis]MDP9799364.1 hypothetical protein [Catenuloplanes nepalensis]
MTTNHRTQHDPRWARRLPPFAGRRDLACDPAHAEEFFPSEDARSIAAAVRICAGCPVAAECAEWAVTTDQRYGIWGGTTAPERHAERRRRNARQRITA